MEEKRTVAMNLSDPQVIQSVVSGLAELSTTAIVTFDVLVNLLEQGKIEEAKELTRKAAAGYKEQFKYIIESNSHDLTPEMEEALKECPTVGTIDTMPKVLKRKKEMVH